jgi:ribosome-binding factor A
MPTPRQGRVANLLKQITSDIIQRELRDPGLGFITVTDADISPDLRQARIYVSILGDDEKRNEGMAALERATSFVRRELGRRAGLRMVPEIKFKFDEAIERGTRIFELIEEVKREEETNAGKHEDGD